MPHHARRSVGPRRAPGAAVLIGALALGAGIAVGFPALFLVVGIIQGIAQDGPAAARTAAAINSESAVLLLRTLRTALLIGLLATTFAWPVTWAMRSWRGSWRALMPAPMLLPSYLAYAGWGLLRSPGTWTGDFLASARPPPWSGQPGYWPLLAGDILAVLGLSLWAWPLAAVILSSGASRLDASTLEALRLEQAPAWRKWACTFAMMRPSILAAIFAVALLMLGSAVPLHLAQMQTFAVHLWLTLDQTPAAQHWAAWLSAWPLVLIAVFAALALSPRLITLPHAGQPASSAPSRTPRASPAALLAAAAVWITAIIVPAVLFAWFIPGWRAVHTFWRVHHEPVETSLAIGGSTFLIGAAIAAASWLGLSGNRLGRRITSACALAFLISGLVPGVLVGSATASAWNAWPVTRWMGDSVLIVVLGHTARFAFVPVLIGAFLARSEPPEERDARRLDGAEGLRGWALACLPAGIGTVAAAGLAAGLLAFHEIESAVILQPPGLDSFPRQMLAFLHFARTQELCCGAILTIGVGVAIAALAVICDWLAGVRWR